jgi:acyl transferase domain-containing protein
MTDFSSSRAQRTHYIANEVSDLETVSIGGGLNEDFDIPPNVNIAMPKSDQKSNWPSVTATNPPKDHDENDFDDKIAICGMAVRLPGGIHTPQQLWKFLLEKGDARSRVPSSRYNVSCFYSPELEKGTVRTEHGYFLDDTVDLRAFDASLFSMPRAELERVDPVQRQLLEVSRECLEDAGEVDWRGKNIGCYVGTFGEDWCEMFAKEPQQHGMYRVGGAGDFMLSNRVSYELDLRGPR